MSAVDSIRESSTTKVPAGHDVEIGKSADGAVDGDEGVGEDGRVVLTEEDVCPSHTHATYERYCLWLLRLE